LALKAVKNWTSLSEMTIRRMIERGEFPRPVKLSSNRVAWRETDVAAFINSRTPVAA
jgi:prophage regulatory protein